MVQLISHNQVERKQATYSYVELILETFTSHQEQGETNGNYYKNFKLRIETLKVHGRKPWVLDLLRKRIPKEAMAETRCTKISFLTEDQTKKLNAKTDK